jgi:hypothetical protein
MKTTDHIRKVIRSRTQDNKLHVTRVELVPPMFLCLGNKPAAHQHDALAVKHYISLYLFLLYWRYNPVCVFVSSIGPWRVSNSKLFRGVVVSPTLNSQPGGLVTTFRLGPAIRPV